MNPIPSDPVARGVVAFPTRPFNLFVRTEVRGAQLLLGTTVLALGWANSPWAAGYEALWSTELTVRVGEAELSKDLRRWVNDGLMMPFFLLLGLQVACELRLAALRSWSAATLPVAAMPGGIVVPALLFLAVNPGGPAARGWVTVLATDAAFAMGMLALLGARCPPQLRGFLLTTVLLSNVGAVATASLLYAERVNVVVHVMALAAVLVLFALVTAVRFLPVLRTFAYLVVGVALWLATTASGIHPAVAAVVLGVVLTAYPPLPTGAAFDAELARLLQETPTPTARRADAAVAPSQRLVELLHPWSSYLVVPLFALANAGVALDGLPARAAGSPVTLGVVAGLVAGKLVGILGASVLAVRTGVGALPRLVGRRHLAAVAALAGLGFTVALFVADLAFTDRAAAEEAKVGVLVAAAVAASLGWLLFSAPFRLPGRRRHRA